MDSADKRPQEFESIVLIVDDEEIRLDVSGWTPEAIGASKPVYKKLFRSSSSAYYPITLDYIQMLVEDPPQPPDPDMRITRHDNDVGTDVRHSEVTKLDMKIRQDMQLH